MYPSMADGLFITPDEFTDEVTAVMSRWRGGPGSKTTLTVVDPSIKGFEQFLPADEITWITGAELIEQAPPKQKQQRRRNAPFRIERIELAGWYHRSRLIDLEELKALAADGYNLVVGNRDDLPTMRRSLNPSTDVALLRGSRSLERLEEQVGHPVFTPEQMIAKHADDGLYEMTAAQRQSLADLLSLKLRFKTTMSLTEIVADAELTAAAKELIAPWVEHLNGPLRNSIDYQAGKSLPEATVSTAYPLTCRMLQLTSSVDVQVLNALVSLDAAGE